MASVIDLTEDDSPGHRDSTATHPQYGLFTENAHAAAGPSTSTRVATGTLTNSASRTIELGDSSDDDANGEDDVVFVRSERLHFPPQGYATGRDGSDGAAYGR